jgi:hypothetical protein
LISLIAEYKPDYGFFLCFSSHSLASVGIPRLTCLCMAHGHK